MPVRHISGHALATLSAMTPARRHALRVSTTSGTAATSAA
ncbi:MAG: hypothetical protein AVDCRST_MAG90-2528 [uncultured Microvirga sp.]|uniref:Uncharacterized protein n=1 Tax=uncultured Microvirga sp. TaxID=412392 RepID=A0A6J4ME20_9HYPH|nr:MAG: hypothetical protein AVDCRST_MAG90-2528 [uncultured Microvirga sp.]